MGKSYWSRNLGMAFIASLVVTASGCSLVSNEVEPPEPRAVVVTVRDSVSGIGLADAAVRIGDQTFVTGDTGAVDIGLQSGTVDYTIVALGYIETPGTFAVTSGAQTVLVPLDSFASRGLTTPSIWNLHPKYQPLCRAFLTKVKANGLRIVFTQTLRTIAEQNALYAQGRTTPGPIVTNAKGGSSWHNYGLAFDVALFSANGKVNWSDNADTDWDGINDWKEMGAIAAGLGITWGGNFVSFKDVLHFEWHPKTTISIARARYASGLDPLVP